MESQETQRVKISHMTSLIIYGETFFYIFTYTSDKDYNICWVIIQSYSKLNPLISWSDQH